LAGCTIAASDVRLLRHFAGLKELAITGCDLGKQHAQELADAVLPACRSLCSLTFNGLFFWKDGGAVTIDTTMTEADFSGKTLRVAGAQILAAFMARTFFQDHGSLVSLNIANNNLVFRGDMSGIIALTEALPKW
jgi:hypothetical protein